MLGLEIGRNLFLEPLFNLLETLKGTAFWVYAAICAAAFVFVALAVPETKGKTLEEIEKSWM